MKFLLPLLVAAILAFAASLTTASPPGGAAPGADAGLPAPTRGPDRRAPAILCEHPDRLSLHRFEDRSARLECAGRVLLRVSVPG